MKAWEVIAIARNGEFVCWDCCDEHEREIWEDKGDDPEISVVFASDGLEPGDCCGRCGSRIVEAQ